MGRTKMLENSMSWIFIIAMLLGLFFPLQTSFLNDYVLILMGIILFVAFLKVDFREMLKYLREPLLLAYLVLMFLIIIPAVIFLSVSAFDPLYAVGFLVIFGAPTAATSAVLVGLFRGNVSLGILLQFMLYLLAPFTLPLLSYYLAGSVISINPLELLISMVQIITIPLILAQLAKRFLKTGWVEERSSLITIILLFVIGMGIMGSQSAFVFENYQSVLFILALLFPLHVAVNAFTYYMAWWTKRRDRLTISISKTFMNGSLALVLVSQFFGPEAVLVAVANIPAWYVYLGIAKKVMK